MSSSGVRLIPKTKDPKTPLVYLSQEKRWQLEAVFAKDPSARTAGEITYLERESQTFVNLRDDVILGIQFFTIEGPNQEQVAEELRSRIEMYSEEELLQWWVRAVQTNDVDDKVDAVLFLGVATPSTPKDEYITRIRAAMHDPNKDVRHAALMAAWYADWSVFVPDLDRISKDDQDETVRKRARVLLDSWGKGAPPTS